MRWLASFYNFQLNVLKSQIITRGIVKLVRFAFLTPKTASKSILITKK